MAFPKSAPIHNIIKLICSVKLTMRYVSYQAYDMNTIKANNPTNIIARNIGDIPDTGMPIALVGGVH